MNDLEDNGTLDVARDPVGSRLRGVRNVRKKSNIEKICNQTKGRKRNALLSASRVGTNVHLRMKEGVSKKMGKFLHISDNQDDIVLGMSNFAVVKTQSPS